MTDTHTAYAEARDALSEVAQILKGAIAIQYDPPPNSNYNEAGKSNDGIPNPTLGIVMDERRMAVSDEVKRTTTLLYLVAAALRPRAEALHTVVNDYEGTGV